MKILLLPSYFIPELMASSHLNDHKYQAFADSHIQMVCYVPQPTRGIDSKTRQKFASRKFEILYEGMMKVYRFPLMRERKNPFQRALRYVLCGIKQLFKGIFAEQFDLLYIGSTPPIQGAIGALVKKCKKVPFIYNLQDIFPDSLVGTGMTQKGSLLWKIGRKIEDFTYRNADKIIVISEDFKKNIMAKGVPEEKIEVIYNWVDEKAVKDVPRANNILFDKYSLSRELFYITYCGNIGLTQNMNMLLDVAKELEKVPDIRILLVGDGAYKDKVEKIIADKDIHNVTLLPFQPYELISEVFSLGDVGLVISKPGVGANSVPSKTWSILSAERPVLASFDENELKTILEKNKCGIFTKAGDKEALLEAVLQLYNNRLLGKEYGKNGRKFILQNLTREVGTRRYIEVIKQFEKVKI